MISRDVANGSGQTKRAYEWITPTEEALMIEELDEKGAQENQDFESLNDSLHATFMKKFASLRRSVLSTSLSVC